MGAKHRMAEIPGQKALRRMTARSAAVFGVASASLLCAGTLAVLVVNGAEPQTATGAAAATAPRRAPQPVTQEGTLIAVSADSVTARSANGYTQTYRITPNTAVITNSGSQSAPDALHFTVNDKVDIVGTIQGGRALATAVATRDVGHGDGPPMDYLDGQVSAPRR